jgi:hypothetical protein
VIRHRYTTPESRGLRVDEAALASALAEHERRYPPVRVLPALDPQRTVRLVAVLRGVRETEYQEGTA